MGAGLHRNSRTIESLTLASDSLIVHGVWYWSKGPPYPPMLRALGPDAGCTDRDVG